MRARIVALVLMVLAVRCARAAEPRTYSLDFSTYFGGSTGEYLRGMTADAQGNVYVAGMTGSRNFPTTPGACQTKYAGGTGEAYVAKFSPVPKP